MKDIFPEIYSIESRKGGVGKTTIALNLAKILVSKEYDVLFIDCDITGTPITYAAMHSVYWKKLVKPSFCDGTSYNLIEYFKNYCLKGEYVEGDIVNKLEYEKGKIHLIGSEIYDGKGKLIIDPRNLLDDLHSFWFVEMIKEIITLFCRISEKSQKAIILDNSPGYVGIGKSIREWLTSVGPKRANFVLVSSLDEQDIESTISSATEIKMLMMAKWEIVQHFFSDSKDVSKIQKLLAQNRELSNFYYSLFHEKQSMSDSNVKCNIRNFLKVIINKVPEGFKDDGKGYIFRDYEDEERKKLIDELFPLSGTRFPRNIIEYDIAISGQFIDSSIKMPTSNELGRINLEEEFKRFDKQIKEYEQSPSKFNRADSLNKSYHKVMEKLGNAGYKRLSKSFSSNAPENYIKELTATIRSFGNVAYPQSYLNGFDRETAKNYEKIELQKFIENNALVEYSAILHSLFESIYKKVGFEKKTSNEYMLFNQCILFMTFLMVQSQSYKQGISYREYLMREYQNCQTNPLRFSNYNIQSITLQENKTITIDTMVRNFINGYFPKFYKSVCYTLLRLIDCASDYRLIMNTFQAMLAQESKSISPDLKKYVIDVVFLKNKDYIEKDFQTLIESPFEMKSIQTLLDNYVLNNRSDGVQL